MLAQGVQFQLKGELSKAAAAFETCLARWPDDPDALNNLAILRDMAGDANAEHLFRRAIELSPANPDAWNNLGRFCQRRGRQTEAIECFEKAVELSSSTALAWVNLAVGYRASKDMDKADAAMDRALQLSGQRPGDDYAIADLLTASGRYEEALALIDRWRDQVAGPELELARLRLLDALERKDEAMEAWRAAVAKAPDDIHALLRIAQAMIDEGEWAWAEELAARIERLEPQATGLDAVRGYVAALRGDLLEAVRLLCVAADKNPDDLALHFELGMVALRQGEEDIGEKAFRRALEIKPDHSSAIVRLAKLLHSRGRAPEAIELLEDALMRLPREPRVMMALGVNYFDIGERERAERLLLDALDINPRLPEGWAWLALIRLTEPERHAEGMELLEKALELAPDSTVLRYNTSLGLVRAGFMDLAYRLVREAIAIDPGYKPAHNNLALFLLSNGEFEEAWREYQWRLPRQKIEQATRDWVPQAPVLDAVVRDGWVRIKGEQGIGDELFFLRFAQLLKAQGIRIAYLPISPKTEGLLRGHPLIDRLLGHADSGEDLGPWVLAGDLPLLTGMKSAADIPPPLPLAPDPTRIARFYVDWLQKYPPPWIGINWWAGTKPANQPKEGVNRRLYKHISIERFTEAIRGLKATYLVLQRNPEAEDLDYLARHIDAPLINCADMNDSLPDMLAALYVLDDLVGVSNTNFHMRACLGKSARVLVEQKPEFRWMRTGNRSPWYPDIEIYRQTRAEGWEPALTRLRSDLQQVIDTVYRSAGASSGG